MTTIMERVLAAANGSSTFGPTAALSASVAALITSESLAFYPGSASFKLLASTAFVYCASTSPFITQDIASVNVIDRKYALIIASSLICGWIGDACLVPSKERYDATTLPPPLKVLQKWAEKKAQALKAKEESKKGEGKVENKEPDEADTVLFKLGMLAFMLNHVGYIVAFTSRGIPLDKATFAGIFLACLASGPFVGIPFPPFITKLLGVGGGGNGSAHSEVRSSSSSSEEVGKGGAAAKSNNKKRPTTRLKRTDSGITDVDITPSGTPVVDAFSSGMSSASSASLASMNNRLTPPPMAKSLSTNSNASSTTSAPSPAPPAIKKKTGLASFIPELEIPTAMAPLIFVYQVIISTMVASSVASLPAIDAASASTVGERGRCIMTAVGALTFMVSDMFVTWDVFAKPIDLDRWRESKVWKSRKERRGWRSRGVGWVLYFGAQMLMARSLH